MVELTDSSFMNFFSDSFSSRRAALQALFSLGSFKQGWLVLFDQSNNTARKDRRMMKRNFSERMMMMTHGHNNSKKNSYKLNKDVKSNRFLININVIGSAGPIRFVVNEDDLVTSVIETALKSYARQGRLPVLGFNANCFLLYCAYTGDALSPWQKIGYPEGRNFLLCKKELMPQMTEGRSEMISQKKNRFKAWLHKSLNFKILSH